MDVRLGSNVIRNTNGVDTIQGKEQLVFEWNPDHPQILLTMDFYTENGEKVAHLRRNVWAVNPQDQLLLITPPDSPALFPPSPWLKIVLKESGESLLEAGIVEQGPLTIPRANFFSHKGQLVEISSHFCRIAGGPTMFGDVFDMRGGAIEIG